MNLPSTNKLMMNNLQINHCFLKQTWTFKWTFWMILVSNKGNRTESSPLIIENDFFRLKIQKISDSYNKDWVQIRL